MPLRHRISFHYILDGVFVPCPADAFNVSDSPVATLVASGLPLPSAERSCVATLIRLFVRRRSSGSDEEPSTSSVSTWSMELDVMPEDLPMVSV